MSPGGPKLQNLMVCSYVTSCFEVSLGNTRGIQRFQPKSADPGAITWAFLALLCIAEVCRGCKWNWVIFNIWCLVRWCEKWSFCQRVSSWCNTGSEGGVLVIPPFWDESQQEASKGLCSPSSLWHTQEMEDKFCCCLVSYFIMVSSLSVNNQYPMSFIALFYVFNRLVGREWIWSSLDPWSHRRSVLSETQGLTTATHTNTSPSSCFTADPTHIRLVFLFLRGINTALVLWWS